MRFTRAFTTEWQKLEVFGIPKGSNISPVIVVVMVEVVTSSASPHFKVVTNDIHERTTVHSFIDCLTFLSMPLA